MFHHLPELGRDIVASVITWDLPGTVFCLGSHLKHSFVSAQQCLPSESPVRMSLRTLKNATGETCFPGAAEPPCHIFPTQHMGGHTGLYKVLMSFRD